MSWAIVKNDQVIEILLKRQPDSARGFDKRGWTP